MTEQIIRDTPEFKALTVPAQWLFFTALRESPRRCGIVDVWPKRYSQLASGLDQDAITGAAQELDRAGIVIFDDETDEMLLPGYLTEVTPVNNKRMLIAVINSVRGVTSLKLIALVVGELQKLRSQTPDAPVWTDPRVVKFLSRPALDQADLAGGAEK